MSDLVEEARRTCECVAGTLGQGYKCFRCRAAAEIERLKKKLAMVQELKAKHHKQDRRSTARELGCRVAQLTGALRELLDSDYEPHQLPKLRALLDEAIPIEERGGEDK